MDEKLDKAYFDKLTREELIRSLDPESIGDLISENGNLDIINFVIDKYPDLYVQLAGDSIFIIFFDFINDISGINKRNKEEYNKYYSMALSVVRTDEPFKSLNSQLTKSVIWSHDIRFLEYMSQFNLNKINDKDIKYGLSDDFILDYIKYHKELLRKIFELNLIDVESDVFIEKIADEFDNNNDKSEFLKIILDKMSKESRIKLIRLHLKKSGYRLADIIIDSLSEE